jgi:HlyD family secretion protein
LLLIVGALVVFLFGVRMESTAPATGVVTSPHIITLRASKAGILEMAASIGRLEPNSDRPITGGTEIARIRTMGDSNPAAVVPVQLPGDFAQWIVLEVHAGDGQRVEEGDSIATMCPIAVDSGVVYGQVRLEIDEKNFGAIAPGQQVRLTSNMFSHRTHGIAKGVIERLEPLGVESPNGGRKFYAWVKVVDRPFELKLGSSLKAEVIVGNKKTWQIILEH